MNDDYPVLEHLEDLRRKLLFCAAFYLLLFAAGVFLFQYMLEIFIRPLPQEWRELYLFRPQDAILVMFKTTALAAFLAVFPFILIQLYRFALPALHRDERRESLLWIVLALILYPAGLVFSYLVLLPGALEFLQRISGRLSGIETFRVSMFHGLKEYLAFVFTLLLGISLVFQSPVLLIILDRLNILRAEKLQKKRPAVLITVLVFSALLTPPDVISQIVLAVPLYALFEMSLGLCFLTRKLRDRNELKSQDVIDG